MAPASGLGQHLGGQRLSGADELPSGRRDPLCAPQRLEVQDPARLGVQRVEPGGG